MNGLVNLSKSTASNFELVFPRLPTSNDIREGRRLTLNIHSTVVPSVNIDSVTNHFQGYEYHQEAGGMKFENWYVNFTVDSKFQNWAMLYKWMFFINNNKNKFGESPALFKVDATLRILDNFRNEICTLTLYGMWINMLGELKLTYREGDQDLSSSANFVYDRYELKGI